MVLAAVQVCHVGLASVVLAAIPVAQLRYPCLIQDAVSVRRIGGRWGFALLTSAHWSQLTKGLLGRHACPASWVLAVAGWSKRLLLRGLLLLWGGVAGARALAALWLSQTGPLCGLGCPPWLVPAHFATYLVDLTSCCDLQLSGV